MSFLRREQPIPRETLELLYVQEKKSMQEVADELGCSVHKVQDWMDKYGMERRSWNDATYVKRNPDGDPFEINEPTNDAERELFTLGVALYIGEGTKRRNDLRLANSDPLVIKAFLKFLRETCGVQENKIKAWLNIFDDADVELALKYWQDVTELPRRQFCKTIVRPSRGGNYLNRSEYGTLTVFVNNKKLGDTIKQWGKELLARQN
jgi:hypothetical protein